MSELLFAFVVSAVWQSTSIAALGLLLARFAGPARQRFELLALTLVAAVASPLVTLVPKKSAPVVPALDLPQIETRGIDAIALVYLAGLAFVALRFIFAALRARRVVASSIPFRGRMRLSDRIDGPVTIGRTVFLPAHVARDRNLLAVVIAHEHAHVRRNDYVMHLALEILALPLYFHPMTMLLRRAIAEAREMACDDAAAERGGRRAYAEALVRLASVAARGRARFAMGMATTPVERRVAALLVPQPACVSRSAAAMLLLVVPLAAATACSRVNVAPAVEQATLCGKWALIREASNLRSTSPPYDAFIQTIDHGPTRVSVRQQRTVRGRTRVVRWSVITDGAWRPVQGENVRGAATWRDGKLQVQMAGPGAHREKATAFLRNGRLVVDGETERGRYHTEFRRLDP